MASETFLKISKLTKEMFVQRHDNEKDPYVNELIRQIPENQKDLESHHKLMVYEGIGHMISMDSNTVMQEQLISSCLQYVDNDWQNILAMANQNQNQLLLPEVIRSVDFIIKVNTRVAEAVGPMYLVYLNRIFQDLLKMYRLYSQCISQSVKLRQQESITKQMKAVRRDILRLIQTYISRQNEMTIFAQQFLPTLQGLVEDYQLSDPNARDPEVLMLFATMLEKMGELLQGFLQQILYNLCDSTLEMIRNDLMSFPEFRECLFKLVESIVKHCTEGFFQLDSDKF